jgi:3-oxoacyl-[acyl-carrier protein] reductase
VRCEAVAGSVADLDVCEAIVGAAVDGLGGVDCLVNNAGITRDRTLGRMTPEEFDDVIAVNLRGTWACGKLASQAMRDAGTRGSIVNVVSNTAFSGAVGQTNYGASKAGVAGMTRTWVRELARYGIRVNAIWPIAQTDMTAGLIGAMQDAHPAEAAPDPWALGFGPPEAVAEVVAYLAGDASSAINGQVITFNGHRLALWSHPREVVAVHRDAWTAETIAAEFEGSLGRQLQGLYDAF